MSYIKEEGISLYGNIMFSPLLGPGVYGTYYKITNALTFGITFNTTTASAAGAQLDNLGTFGDSITVVGQPTVSISFNKFNEKSLALALMSRDTRRAAVGAQAETFVPVYIGGAAVAVGGSPQGHMPHRGIDVTTVDMLRRDVTVASATGFAIGNLVYNDNGQLWGQVTNLVGSVLTVNLAASGYLPAATHVITNGTATTTVSSVVAANVALTAGTDFEYYTEDTRIAKITGGAMDGADYFAFDYDWSKPAEVEFEIGDLATLQGRLVIQGVNRVSARRFRAVIKQATMSVNGLLELMNVDPAGANVNRMTATLEGALDAVDGSLGSVFAVL